MSNQLKKVVIPDIGGASGVDVIEILVKPGDRVKPEDSLITLEGDKATMEVPSPFAGVVAEVAIKVGDKVSEGDLMLTLDVADTAKKATKESSVTPATLKKSSSASSKAASVQTVRVPDIGGAAAVDVIEVMVKPGDKIKVDDSIITLEGDKATMEVPSPLAGVVSEVKIKVGDKVAADDIILTIESTNLAAIDEQFIVVATPELISPPVVVAASSEMKVRDVHAGPAVRRVASEFDIDLKKVPATGEKGRITREDMQRFVKQRLAIAETGGSVSSVGFNLPPAPKVDFSKFGETEMLALTKIQKFSGANLLRNWMSIPHITQFGEADTTELEAFRAEQKEEAAKQGIKLTPLVFLLKAAVLALKEFPKFNASLDSSGEQLILKKYYNMGVAVDTPNGLVVPVIRNVDKKGLYDLARELGEISEKARTTGLGMADMQGGCFTISSLGGIGGTAFTPIINAPEVAILGVSRSFYKPEYQKDGSFQPRLMLPLSLSYDHRVIDGADGARFMVYFASRLADIRTLLL